MIAEGLDLGDMRLALELELRYGSSPVTQRIPCRTLRLESQAEVNELYRDFRAHLMNLSFGVDLPEAPVRIETFALSGSIPGVQGRDGSSGLTTPRQPRERRDSSQGERRVIWDSSLERVRTPVFVVEDLGEGDRIAGPAIGEARDTTYVVPPGWELSILKGAVGELRKRG